MENLSERLKWASLTFWVGGALFVVLGAFALILVSQDDPLSAEFEWVPVVFGLAALAGLVACVTARVAENFFIERALQTAYAQIQASQPGSVPNDGVLAKLAGLPDDRIWQARQFLARVKN